jgi:hypothetical protein
MVAIIYSSNLYPTSTPPVIDAIICIVVSMDAIIIIIIGSTVFFGR